MKHATLPALALLLALAACNAVPAPGSSPVPEATASGETTQAEEATPSPDDDLVELYFQVLEDLWAEDEGLNSGLTYLGVDLSGLTHLPQERHHDLAQRFADAHGLELLEDTWEGLCHNGYIDRDALCWEDGLYFEIKTDHDAAWNDPALGPEDTPPRRSQFDAHKWRGGLGAFFYSHCTAQRLADGTWTYSVGQIAVA